MRRLLSVALAVTSVAAGLEKWTVDRILQVRQVGDVAISPDGRYVLYSLSGSVPAENRQYSDLYVVASDGSATRQLTRDDAKEESPRWTPDSRLVSYLAPDAQGKPQVRSVAPTGGAPTQWTSSPQGVRSYGWSPDGSRVWYAASEPKSNEQVAHEKEWGVVISPEEEWPERASLWVLDTATRQTRRLTDGRLAPGSPEWSPDGRTIAFLHAEGPGRPQQLHLAAADGAGPPRAVTHSAIGVNSFAWSPQSAQIAYVEGREDPPPYANYFRRQVFLGRGSVWWLDATSGRATRLTRQEYPGLARVVWSRGGKKLTFLAKPPGSQNDRRALEVMHILTLDGEVRTVAPGFDFLRGGIGSTWSKDDREIWFLNGERMGYNIFAVDAGSGAVRYVTTGQDCLSEVSYTRDFSRAAFVSENANTKPDVYVATLPEWRAARITDLNPEVRQYAHGPGEIIRYSSEGRQIEALLVKPPDFDPSRKYPLLLILHGGPTWYKKNDWRLHWEQQPIQVYAAEGYCLVFPNVRGSADYGPEFRQANYRDLGGGDFRDAMAAVDYLVGQGFVDENRLGVAGWSYGGFLTPAAITQTDRFKAAQFGAGIPSFEAMYSRLSTVEWIVHDNYGARPWEDGGMHLRESPLYSAHRVKTPTLIQHGEDDPRCPMGGAVLFYKALKSYGVPAVLEIYPKEGHGITGPLLKRRCLRRNLEWFNKWLKGDRTTSFEKPFPPAQ
ncbi:MAG: S9 family peptidase [Acidobacteria bacterium]|nr:S9 family peptidase [Acidobacteriota bacterium]